MKDFLPSYIASNESVRRAIKAALTEAVDEGTEYEAFLQRKAYSLLFRQVTEKAAKARDDIYDVINKLHSGAIDGKAAMVSVFALACDMKAQDDLILSLKETISLGKDARKELANINEFDKQNGILSGGVAPEEEPEG